MPKLRLFVLTLVAINFLACSQTDEESVGGDVVTETFLDNYNGVYAEQSGNLTSRGEKMTIHRDGSIEVLKHRQVGQNNNPAIPNPTLCSFILKGQILYVVQLDAMERTKLNSKGKPFEIPETHRLVFGVEEMALTNELQEDSRSNQGCLNFEEQMNDRLPVYTYGMELFGSGTIRFHTRDEDNYDGGERTESTLDEVFMRVNF